MDATPHSPRASSNGLLEPLRNRLTSLRRHQLSRELTSVVDGAEPWLAVDGERLLNLSSNNYLGLANHPEIIAAAIAATQELGCGAGSSRLVAGSSSLHQSLETRLAEFKGVEAALLFNSGYTANLGVIPALVGAGDGVWGDELNHASLIDGCRLSGAAFHSYAHCDAASLDHSLAQHAGPSRRRLVVTDTVFSMDGDRAPLNDIADVCARHQAMLMVDEAHATGCLGPNGRGLVAELGLDGRVTLSMSTLSKALGSFGAFVTGPRTVIDLLLNTARSFMFTTALPPSVVAASLAALDLISRDSTLLDRLHTNAARLRDGLLAQGYDVGRSASQIIPIMVGDTSATLAFARGLREEGVFAVAIRPPTVPRGASRIRVSAIASHSDADIEHAIHAFKRVGQRMGRP